MPGAMMVAMLQGESAPRWKSAPLTKPPADRLGPGGITLSVKLCVNVPAEAVTVTVPGVAPAVAVAVICARPFEPVLAVEAERVAGPETLKDTGKLATGWPLLPLTCTTNGEAKGCPA